jgi:S1-C subfamily serine protease
VPSPAPYTAASAPAGYPATDSAGPGVPAQSTTGYGPPSFGPPAGAPPGFGPAAAEPPGFGPASADSSGFGPAAGAPPGFGSAAGAPPGFGPAPGHLPPFGAAPAEPPRGRVRKSRPLLVTAIAVLLAVVGVQAFVLLRVEQGLDKAYGRLDQAEKDAQERAQALQERVTELENSLGRQFNPEAIASAVVPSVFRVRAGRVTGTAFAVGKNTASGGTNLFTNYHVVEGVYTGGGRQVFLERQDKRFPARIVAVDKGNDVAHLQTTSKFAGLTAARAPVKAGQQIVVVGAPLGLEDTVTTGVVSAFRDIDEFASKVIQFDASINPGNSGGPVINSAKQVVGIASAKARDAEGIGLAVSIATACGKFKIC